MCVRGLGPFASRDSVRLALAKGAAGELGASTGVTAGRRHLLTGTRERSVPPGLPLDVGGATWTEGLPDGVDIVESEGPFEVWVRSVETLDGAGR